MDHGDWSPSQSVTVPACIAPRQRPWHPMVPAR